MATTRGKNMDPFGQGLVEYALILLMVGVIVMAALLVLGPTVGNTFSKVGSFPTATAVTMESTPTPICPTSNGGQLGIIADMEQRILTYYGTHGAWPRSWLPYSFTDIGLNPADWAGLVECIHWVPNGGAIGLANVPGDNIQIYVNKLHANGKATHLYDGWSIWCVASTSQCYYHTIANGNEVDINTLVVVEQ